MIVREAEVNDFVFLKGLLDFEGLSSTSLLRSINEASDSLIVDSGGIQGFVLVRPLAELNEISYWSLKPGFELLFDSLQKKVAGPLAVHERVSSVGRINLLKSVGFREVRTVDGLYSDSKAVMLVRD